MLINKEQVKEINVYNKVELVKRYMYLYKNAQLILAPFVCEDKGIYLKNIDTSTLKDLEEILLSEIPLEKTKGYLKINNIKTKKPYLNMVQNGLKLQAKQNKEVTDNVLKLDLNLWTLLSKVRSYINSQISDYSNKNLKLRALDEYFKINRYSNDGRIWTSGYGLNSKDIIRNSVEASNGITNENIIGRPKFDVGVKNNAFINYFADGGIHFSEKEKQSIYLKFHDELPWDLSINCNEKNKQTFMFIFDSTVEKVSPSETCGKDFHIKEQDIFINEFIVEGTRYIDYYQLCPNCGNIIKVPDKLLSDGIKQRIVSRCDQDKNLFKKMCLYSELKALEKTTPDENKRLIKK